MKKLVAIVCGFLCLHNISNGNATNNSSPKTMGDERTLIRALVNIINPSARRKEAAKTALVPPDEYPW